MARSKQEEVFTAGRKLAPTIQKTKLTASEQQNGILELQLSTQAKSTNIK